MNDRTDHEDEVALERELIRRSRSLIAETDELVSTSRDRIVESVKRIRATQIDKEAMTSGSPD